MAIYVAELFEVELGVFHEHLEKWIVHDIGRFVLIKDAEVRGPYDTQNDAITVGYETFGNVPFLTKQIMPFEHPIAFKSSVLERE